MTRLDKNILSDAGPCLTAEELMRYRDNKLSATERHRIESHLLDCSLCAEAVEGAAFIHQKEVLSKLNDDVRQLVRTKSPGQTVIRKYWAAAATVAAFTVMAAYLFKEYNNVQHENVAIHSEPAQLPETGVNKAYISAAEANAVTDSQLSAPTADQSVPANTEKSNAEPLQITQSDNFVVADELAEASNTANTQEAFPAEQAEITENNDTTTVDAVSVTGSSTQTTTQSSQYLSNQMSYPKLKVQTQPGKKYTDATSSSKQRSTTAPLSKTNETTADGDITYLHNMKVIAYNNESIREEDLFSNGTSPEFENKEKKEATMAEMADAPAIKVSYLDFIDEPVKQFADENYKEAIVGFNRVLEQFPNDMNATFYKGMSLYILGKHNDAIAILSAPANNSGCTFKDEATFYMAKSYAALGKTVIAADLYKGLIDGKGFYSGRAHQELQLIKK